MDQSVRITVEVDSADHAVLSQIAQRSGRSIDQVANAALRACVEEELDFDAGMRAGLADIAAGRVISHEEYLAHAAERRRRWLADRPA